MRDYHAISEGHDGAGAASWGAPGKRTLTSGLRGKGAGLAPTPGDGGPDGDLVPHEDPFAMHLIDDGVEAKAAGGRGAAAFEGEQIYRNGPFTEAHRESLLRILEARVKENFDAVGDFLREFVDASVTIVARYAMDSVKEESQLAGVIKFALAEGLAAMAGGVAGLAAKKAIEVLASTAVDYFAGELMEDGEVFQDEKGMDALIKQLAGDAGNYVDTMVSKLGDDVVALAYWLGNAPLEELHRFRIPYRFEGPPRELIRGAVAGSVAGAHHRLKEGGQMMSGPQYVETDKVDPVHDNHVLLIDVLARGGEAHVDKARFKTNSATLRDEIVNEVGLGSLPTVAMHVKLTEEEGVAGAVQRLLTALRAPFPIDPGDTELFTASFPAGKSPLVFTRMPDGTFGVEGGTLAEDLVLYQWATGDHDLSRLARFVNDEAEEDEEGQASRPSYLPADEMAATVELVIGLNRVKGARNMATSRMFDVQVPTKG